MQRTGFFGDMLSQLFDRQSRARGKDDARSITELCEALLGQEGEVSGYRLAATVLERYKALSTEEKRAFFLYLNDALEIDAARLADLAGDYAETPSPDLFVELSHAAEPRRQELLRRLNQPAGATADIVAMRVDLLAFVKELPELKRTDVDFVHLLKSWFNRGFLVLSQINWDTPARILDKIVAYEAVHAIDDFDDLRRRLYPSDRRCFAFFHPAMPDEPLIFVEVALTKEIPSSIGDLLSDARDLLSPEDAKVATFYSISNCQRGLRGISFGNLLIKQVVSELSSELPGIDRFVTLSPLPGFAKWLAQEHDDTTLATAAQDALSGRVSAEMARALAARYLLQAKDAGDAPLDPVARFHLGNGAEVHALHDGADLSDKGMEQSIGVMVNYLYDLSQTERNHEAFALENKVVASRAVQSLATAALPSRPKEATP